jgi:pimeloyl-ACP methyl ester carboxylesterase
MARPFVDLLYRARIRLLAFTFGQLAAHRRSFAGGDGPVRRFYAAEPGGLTVRLNTCSWDHGGGSPIVCVHGVSGHAQSFRKLAEDTLADRRVLALDLRGHGRSGWEPPWNLETHVADLAETATAHAVERATWIGFSLGGRLVAELAATARAVRAFA